MPSPGNVPARPIACPRTVPNGSWRSQPSRPGEDRVVAHLGVRVQREVVAGQRDVVLEQGPQALGEDRREAGRQEVPEQSVVDEHELRPLCHGALDQRALGRDAGHDALHLAGAGDLQAVGAEIAERVRRQQLVERGED